MKTLIFDPFSGASGDMILGSLIDLGADADLI
ncbi:MAG: nickel insertion protein, partial [Methanosarcinales archaeon]